MRILGAALLAVVGSACASPPPAAQDVAPDPRAPYAGAKSDPVTYRVDFRAIVTAPYKTKVLRVWIPVPPSDAAQEVSGSAWSVFPTDVAPAVATEPVHGNTFAYFEFKEPQGAQIIQHLFTVKVWEMRWNLDPGTVAAAPAWPAGFEPYLRSEAQAVVIDDRVKAAAGQAVPSKSGAAGDLAKVLHWVNANMKYTHDGASLQASSQHALTARSGHCSDYHGLCSAMGRSLGYPTRIAYGINPFPKNGPSHCKLESFIPGRGWVSFDVSEAQKQIAEIAKDPSLDAAAKKAYAAAVTDRLVRGFRDNTWYLQTRGSDYDLVPKASKKVPVVRTLYAEADGKALKDPDPNGPIEEFGWMTAHAYVPDRPVSYPFKGVASLKD